MFKQITDQIRERTIQQQQDAAAFRVYTVRNADDDGAIFFPAKSKADAVKQCKAIGRDPSTVRAARHAELQSIAVRGLKGWL